MTLTLHFYSHADRAIEMVNVVVLNVLDSGQAVTFANVLNTAAYRVQQRPLEYMRRWPNRDNEYRMSERALQEQQRDTYAVAYRAWLTLEEYADPA